MKKSMSLPLSVYVYIKNFKYRYLICFWGTFWLPTTLQQEWMNDPSPRNPFLWAALQVARRRFFSNEFELAHANCHSLICQLAIYSMAHPSKVIFTQETEASPFLWHCNLKSLVSFYPWSQDPSSIKSVERLPGILTAFRSKPRWMLYSVLQRLYK